MSLNNHPKSSKTYRLFPRQDKKKLNKMQLLHYKKDKLSRMKKKTVLSIPELLLKNP